MPLYEYKCDKCGSVFEIIQKFVDEPLSTHDNCGGAVVRLISTSALLFKGSGFYITDYNKTGSTKPASSGGKAPDSEGGGKSDSSPPPSKGDSGGASPSTSTSSSTSSDTGSSSSSSSGSSSSGDSGSKKS